jgi:hypothetical protein
MNMLLKAAIAFGLIALLVAALLSVLSGLLSIEASGRH